MGAGILLRGHVYELDKGACAVGSSRHKPYSNDSMAEAGSLPHPTTLASTSCKRTAHKTDREGIHE
jgi:hypothetical protein